MHSLFDDLLCEEEWIRYYRSKSRFMKKQSQRERTQRFVAEHGYRDMIDSIRDGSFVYPVPIRRSIQQKKGKTRVVYSFDDMFTFFLGMVAKKMDKYDGLFSDNLYSYRKDRDVKDALSRIIGIGDLGKMYAFKADISKYFYSIDTERLFDEQLKKDLSDDSLYSFFRNILCSDRVMSKGEEISDPKKGVLAGIPIAGFFANYYLRDMDFDLSGMGAVYIRFADDVIIISESKEKVAECRGRLHQWIDRKGLSINPSKEKEYSPGDVLDFLGLSFDNGRTDIRRDKTEATKYEIRKEAERTIRNIQKGRDPDMCTEAFRRHFEKKFLGRRNDDISWATWYFPLINTNESLKEIDLCYKHWIRRIFEKRTGKKWYYTISEDYFRTHGYRFLVSEFRKYTERNNSKSTD